MKKPGPKEQQLAGFHMTTSKPREEVMPHTPAQHGDKTTPQASPIALGAESPNTVEEVLSDPVLSVRAAKQYLANRTRSRARMKTARQQKERSPNE